VLLAAATGAAIAILARRLDDRRHHQAYRALIRHALARPAYADDEDEVPPALHRHLTAVRAAGPPA
jgi:hypothetical protein